MLNTVCSISSKLVYMGLGILGVGGATRRNKTFATSTGSYKGLCTDSTTEMLDEALRGCSCCCSKSLMACCAFPLLIGTAAGMLFTVLLTSSSLVFNMEALQRPCSTLSTNLLFFQATCSYARLQLKCWLKENSSLGYSCFMLPDGACSACK